LCARYIGTLGDKVADRCLSRNKSEYQSILDYASKQHLEAVVPFNLAQWRVLQKQLDAPTPKPVDLREPHEYAGIRINAARSPRRVVAQMRQLAVVVCVLPVIVWLLAATAGRWYFQHALQPLRAMAARARSMEADDFGLRLPVAKSGDELTELGCAQQPTGPVAASIRP
jgi:hypothetical protein